MKQRARSQLIALLLLRACSSIVVEVHAFLPPNLDVCSYVDYEPLWSSVHYMPTVLERTLKRKGGKLGPFQCPVCGSNYAYASEWDPNALRESGRCSICNESNRKRQLAYVINHVASEWARREITSIAEAANVGMRIYNTEVDGAIHEFLMDSDGYVASTFFGERYKSGQLVNGVRHEDVQQLSFQDSSFDLVISAEVFEYLPEPYLAHEEVFRVLRPGGSHVFTVPYAPNSRVDIVKAERHINGSVTFKGKPELHREPLFPDGMPVYRVFSRGEMLKRLCSIGFEVMDFFLQSPNHGIISGGSHVFRARKPPLNQYKADLERCKADLHEAQTHAIDPKDLPVGLGHDHDHDHDHDDAGHFHAEQDLNVAAGHGVHAQHEPTAEELKDKERFEREFGHDALNRVMHREEEHVLGEYEQPEDVDLKESGSKHRYNIHETEWDPNAAKKQYKALTKQLHENLEQKRKQRAAKAAGGKAAGNANGASQQQQGTGTVAQGQGAAHDSSDEGAYESGRAGQQQETQRTGVTTRQQATQGGADWEPSEDSTVVEDVGGVTRDPAHKDGRVERVVTKVEKALQAPKVKAKQPGPKQADQAIGVKTQAQPGSQGKQQAQRLQGAQGSKGNMPQQQGTGKGGKPVQTTVDSGNMANAALRNAGMLLDEDSSTV